MPSFRPASPRRIWCRSRYPGGAPATLTGRVGEMPPESDLFGQSFLWTGLFRRPWTPA
jgi:hypothetical protein